MTAADPWSCSLLSPSPSPSSDDDESQDHAHTLTADHDLARELDLSRRDDRAVVKKTPFTLAKLRATTAESKPRTTGEQAHSETRKRIRLPGGPASPSPKEQKHAQKQPVKKTDWKNNSGWTNHHGAPVPHCAPSSKAKEASSTNPKKKAAALKPKAASKLKKDTTLTKKGKKADADDKIEFKRLPTNMSPSKEFPIVAGLERQKSLPVKTKAKIREEGNPSPTTHTLLDVDELVSGVGGLGGINKSRSPSATQRKKQPQKMYEGQIAQTKTKTFVPPRKVSPSPKAVQEPNLPSTPKTSLPFTVPIARPVPLRSSARDVARLEALAEEHGASSPHRSSPPGAGGPRLHQTPFLEQFRRIQDPVRVPKDQTLPAEHPSLLAHAGHRYSSPPRGPSPASSSCAQAPTSPGLVGQPDDIFHSGTQLARPSAAYQLASNEMYTPHRAPAAQPPSEWQQLIPSQQRHSPEEEWSTLPKKRRLTFAPSKYPQASSTSFTLPPQALGLTPRAIPPPTPHTANVVTKVTVWAPTPPRSQAYGEAATHRYVPPTMRALDEASRDHTNRSHAFNAYPTPASMRRPQPAPAAEKEEEDWMAAWDLAANVASRARAGLS